MATFTVAKEVHKILGCPVFKMKLQNQTRPNSVQLHARQSIKASLDTKQNGDTRKKSKNC